MFKKWLIAWEQQYICKFRSFIYVGLVALSTMLSRFIYFVPNGKKTCFYHKDKTKQHTIEKIRVSIFTLTRSHGSYTDSILFWTMLQASQEHRFSQVGAILLSFSTYSSEKLLQQQIVEKLSNSFLWLVSKYTQQQCLGAYSSPY